MRTPRSWCSPWSISPRRESPTATSASCSDAAELCAWLMKTARFGNYTRPQFRLAMDRLVQLLPVLEPAEAQKLIREQLFKQTATLTDLISIIGELGQTAGKGTDLQARAASLGTQHLILEALVSKEDQLPSNIAVLVMNWLTEAEGCYRAGGVVATEMTQAERMMMRRYGMSRQAEITTLSTEQILSTAPPLELVPRLNPGLAQRVQLTLLKVNILRPDQADLKLLRDYVKTTPVSNARFARTCSPAGFPSAPSPRKASRSNRCALMACTSHRRCSNPAPASR